MIRCIECGNTISDKSETCVHCGAPTSISIKNICPTGEQNYICKVNGWDKDFSEFKK